MADIITQKPWGREVLLHQGYGYAVKLISIFPGQSTSLHFHRVKHEYIFVVSSKLSIELYPSQRQDSSKHHELLEGESIGIEPAAVHRMFNETEQELRYLECQTDHLDDVVRVKDFYGRV